MKQGTVLEIGKICLNTTTFDGAPECDSIAFEWVEDSSYCLYPDNEVSIDIERDDAIKLIDVLSKHFGLNTRADGWISVDDRLPTANERILAFDSGGFGILSARYSTRGWYLEGELDNFQNITHWMPWPAPPVS